MGEGVNFSEVIKDSILGIDQYDPLNLAGRSTDMSMLGCASYMMKESQMQLLDKFSITTDKKEFMEIGKKLFPEITQERLEEMYKETTS